MIPCIGVDMALANMGLVAGSIAGGKFTAHSLKLVSTEGQDKKTVRKSSNDLRRAQELVAALRAWCELNKPAFAFAEVPSGSQSASAARALGIAVGVLASCPVQVIEVSQLEVKTHSVGKRTASKAEMIEWACARWPDAPWLTHGSGAKKRLTQANEHLADACAAVVAGLQTPEFKLLQSLSAHYETTSHSDQRSPLHGIPQGRVQMGRLPIPRRPMRRGEG